MRSDVQPGEAFFLTGDADLAKSGAEYAFDGRSGQFGGVVLLAQVSADDALEPAFVV